MTVIIDYGVGNLFSLQSSFSAIGEKAVVSSEKDEILSADRIILPGVGAFRDAADKLFSSGLADAVKEAAAKKIPLLGICLGMQLLFDKSFEYGEYEGLHLISGEIKPIKDLIGDKPLKIPHMGWNKLNFKGEKHPIFKYLNAEEYAYFVHSYCAVDCEKSIIATAEYGAEITAAVAKDNIIGCQFHPEKSGAAGLKILKAFCETGGKI